MKKEIGGLPLWAAAMIVGCMVLAIIGTVVMMGVGYFLFYHTEVVVVGEPVLIATVEDGESYLIEDHTSVALVDATAVVISDCKMGDSFSLEDGTYEGVVVDCGGEYRYKITQNDDTLLVHEQYFGNLFFGY